MLRVYLDQNKRIDLARAAHGLPDGAKYRDALDMARYGVEKGLVSFPLSSVHYMETLKRKDAPSRHRLASVMCELSRFHTMAPPDKILPAELDAALRARYGRPATPLPLRVFGYGMHHAFGEKKKRFRLPADAPHSPEERYQVEEWATALLERAALFGPSEGTRVPGMKENEYFKEFGERYASGELLLAQKLREEGATKDQRKSWLAALEVIDIIEPLNDALRRAGISEPESVEMNTAEGMTALLQDLPSRAVVYELRRLRHEDPSTQWEPGDLDDVTALGLGIAYCDVVVTERQWVHLAQRASLDARFQTTILSDVSVLPHRLAIL